MVVQGSLCLLFFLLAHKLYTFSCESNQSHFVSVNGTQNSWEMPYTLVTCCSRTSTHYSEKQTLRVFLLYGHYGWNSHKTKLLLATMKPSWSVMVCWCKEFILRYFYCLRQLPSGFCFRLLVPLLNYNYLLVFMKIREQHMLQYICLAKNHGMTWEMESHTLEARLTRWTLRRKAFLRFKRRELLSRGKTGFDEVLLKWTMILILWYLTTLPLSQCS